MSVQKNDPVKILVEHALEAREEQIPPELMNKGQELFQDTLACILAGSTSAGIEPLLEVVRLWGGHRQATVLGFSEQTSVPFAALINSVMGHARDFDDTHDRAVNHGCVTLVPAMLAMSEFISAPEPAEEFRQHNIPFRKVSGAEFLAALVVGLDVANRLGNAFVRYLHTGWLPTTLWGGFSCAAAGARLLKMDLNQAYDAFGLAYSQVHGNRQALADGALAKRMQPGFSSFAGIQALFMALKGISGSRNILQGAFGISELYANSNIDLNCITEGLGKTFETANISMKPYPSCRCTHAVIDAALKLKNEHEFNAEDILNGEIYLPPVSMGQIGNPFRVRDNPTVDAQFSAQFTTALSLLKGKPGLDDFEAESVTSAANVIKLAGLFKTIEFRQDTRELVPVEMIINLRDGRKLKTTVNEASGSPGTPMSEDDVRFKFNDCVRHCKKPYSQAQINDLLEILQNLKQLDDMSDLFKFL